LVLFPFHLSSLGVSLSTYQEVIVILHLYSHHLQKFQPSADQLLLLKSGSRWHILNLPTIKSSSSAFKLIA
jgi:hypothetical protein